MYFYSSQALILWQLKNQNLSALKKDAFEIREYQPKLIAQVLVNGTFDSASSKGFRLLADFIFGNNKTIEGSKRLK